MTTQIWLDHTGGPEVLQVRTIDRDAPGPGQVWLDQEAIGVNYLDVTQRMGAVVLLYGVAGAVGQVLSRWATHLGATVISVVSRPESINAAKAAGCTAVLVWGRDDLPEGVRAATGGRKADVVYDGIGRETFDTSLDCLRPRGLMVAFGASSGTPDPVAIEMLNRKGSLYLTRPGLGAHISDLTEYRERARAV